MKAFSPRLFHQVFGAVICFGTMISTQASDAVKPLHENKMNIFPLDDIRITGGRFKTIQEQDHAYLLTLEPDRLLSWFRREAGLMPKAEPYPFWESDDAWGKGPLAGHIMGFYLSSMSMMYQSTHDGRILERLRYVLSELKTAQDTQGDGYLLATINGKRLFEQVRKGQFTTSNPLINDTWEPVYIMNKIMLGLYNAYDLCGLKEARPILIGMADWFGTAIIDKLSHDDMQKLLVCEHGSINESFVDVYRMTGEKKYLDWANKLNDEDMWVPLSEGKDILNGWHANTQIPKFTGFNSIAQYTDNPAFKRAANLFWDIVVKNHTWINGGNSAGEHFFEEHQFENKIQTYAGPESCNSVNMMRLTESLWQTDPKPERIEYYEQVLFNHIAANYDPEEGMCCYYTGMRPGHYKVYGTKYDSFWCCTGTGLEAPAKLAKMVYSYSGNDLYVNLFMPTELNWREKGVSIVQDTRFPDENTSNLTVSTAEPQQFEIKIRRPNWIEDGSFLLKINGETVQLQPRTDGYIPINREWKNGDRIEISFTPVLKVQHLKASRRYAAITYGPIVLAAAVPNTNIGKDEFRHARKLVADVMNPISDAPVLFGSQETILKHMKRLPGAELKYQYAPEEAKAVELIPFSRLHFTRYAIYMIHAADLAEYKRTVQSNDKFTAPPDNILANTIDSVKIGDGESERRHQIRKENNMLTAYDMTSFWRRANQGGWFEYTFRTLVGKKAAVFTAVRASDQDEIAFDIIVNGRVIGSLEHFHGKAPAATTFYQKTFPIPADLSADNAELVVRVASRAGRITGDVLDLRIIAQE